VPVVQTWFCVQLSFVVHGVLSGSAGSEHPPSDWHVPAEWQLFDCMHVFGFMPVHAPPTQVSVCVHGLPSSHGVPSVFGTFVHIPLIESHTPS
jgi:hypothetical protein